MNARIALPTLVAALLAAPAGLSLATSLALSLAMSPAMSPAMAQSHGPDEAHDAAANVERTITLTSSQKRMIFAVVSHQRLHTPVADIPLVVGAPVPPATRLLALPEEAAGGDEAAQFLKYATVDGNVVLVDSIGMRVIDIIRDGAGQ